MGELTRRDMLATAAVAGGMLTSASAAIAPWDSSACGRNARGAARRAYSPSRKLHAVSLH